MSGDEASITDAATRRDPSLPSAYRVGARHDETRDTSTLTLEPLGRQLPRFRPGQFMMLYARGVGEIPVSICGDPAQDDGAVVHTVRSVGAVSHALREARVGDVVGVRGPYGTGWDLETAKDDLVIAAGGVGLAAVRSAALAALGTRSRFRRVAVMVGARRPSDLLYRGDLASWAGRGAVEVELAVDLPEPGWRGHIGFVTQILNRLDLEPRRTTVLLCGPEPMMRLSARTMIGKGIAPADIRVSLERNMQCGSGLCGHCQLGELLLCRDGPVVDYAVAAPLLDVREL